MPRRAARRRLNMSPRSPAAHPRQVAPPMARADPPHPGRRRLGLLAAVSVVVVAGGIAASLAISSSGGGSGGAALANVTAPRPPYVQIEYEVVNSSSRPPVTTWEVLTLYRPFGATDLTYDSPPGAGNAPASGTVSTYDGLYSLNHGRLQDISGRQPGPGSGDQALGPELSDLVQRGLARSAHRTMTVAGRRCQVVTMSQPPAGPITPQSGADHDDVCIDTQGIELSERWTYKGRVVLERTALSVALDPRAARQFAGAPPVSSAVPVPVAILAVTIGAAKTYLATPAPPVGFKSDEAVTTVAFDPTAGSAEAGSTIWSFSHGGDVVTVEAGEGLLPWQAGDTPTRPVTLAGLGPDTTALTSDGPQIRVQLSQNRWVRVSGTVPLAQLSLYASGLRLART